MEAASFVTTLSTQQSQSFPSEAASVAMLFQQMRISDNCETNTSMQTIMGAWQQNLQTHQQEIDLLSQRVINQEANIRQFQQQIQEGHHLRQQEKQVFNAREQEYENTLVTINQIIVDLRQENGDLINNFTQERVHSGQQISSLESQQREAREQIESLNRQLASIGQQLQEKTSFGDSLQQQLIAKTASEVLLNQQLQEKSTSINELSNQLQSKIESETSLYNQLQAKIVSEALLNQQLQEKNRSITELSGQLQSKIESETYLNNQLQAKIVSETSLNVQLAQLQTQLQIANEKEQRVLKLIKTKLSNSLVVEQQGRIDTDGEDIAQEIWELRLFSAELANMFLRYSEYNVYGYKAEKEVMIAISKMLKANESRRYILDLAYFNIAPYSRYDYVKKVVVQIPISQILKVKETCLEDLKKRAYGNKTV